MMTSRVKRGSLRSAEKRKIWLCLKDETGFSSIIKLKNLNGLGGLKNKFKNFKQTYDNSRL